MSQAERRLPKAVDMIGDRIGLNYNIPRRETTEIYVKNHGRLDITNLKFSTYSLSEVKTKKIKGQQKVLKSTSLRNPLKLNAKRRKDLYRLTPLERHNMKYQTMVEIHQVWLQYAQKVLEINPGDATNIYKIDLHGCKLKCIASRNPTLVEHEGIVVQETKNTFLIISRTDRLITLPKRESIFEFSLNERLYRIHGCNLMTTTQARSKNKYKQQRSISDV